MIGNVVSIFQDDLKETVNNLLVTAESPGTVVRWASPYALAEILKLKTAINKLLLPMVQALYNAEENEGVRKKYLYALKILVR